MGLGASSLPGSLETQDDIPSGYDMGLGKTEREGPPEQEQVKLFFIVEFLGDAGKGNGLDALLVPRVPLSPSR